MKKMLVLLCLALGGCLTTGKRGGDAAMAVYDFGPPPRHVVQPSGMPPLAIEVRAPYWFDSLGIEYRLAYSDPARLRDYGQARWAGPPATLMEQRLIQSLGLVPTGQGGARCLIRIDLEEFSQVFASPSSSEGVLAGKAFLLDRGRSRQEELSLRIGKPAPTADSRGGVAALTAAVDQAVADLAAWRDELSRSGHLKGCEKRG